MQQLRTQVEALNGQLAQATHETDQLRQQTVQVQMQANDASAKADVLANRLQSMERNEGGKGGGKDFCC